MPLCRNERIPDFIYEISGRSSNNKINSVRCVVCVCASSMHQFNIHRVCYITNRIRPQHETIVDVGSSLLFSFLFFFCFLLRSLSALSHLLVAAQFPTSTICYVGFAFYLFIFLFSFRQWPHSPFHTLERTMYCSCLLHVCIYNKFVHRPYTRSIA